jgi:hypothetical protein
LIVGGGSAGHPPAGLSCFAGQDTDEGTSLMMPRHRLKNIINKKVLKTPVILVDFAFPIMRWVILLITLQLPQDVCYHFAIMHKHTSHTFLRGVTIKYKLRNFQIPYIYSVNTGADTNRYFGS